MKKFFGKNGGFTIVELMTASFITALFATAFYIAATTMHNEMVLQNQYFDTNRDIRYTMEKISRDLKESVSIISSHGGNTTGDSVLILKLPSIDSSGEPTNIDLQYDYVTYKVNPSNSKQLFRSLDVLGGTSTREGGSDQSDVVIANNLSSIEFASSGTGLSSISASTLATLKRINVQITSLGKTLGRDQSTQIDSDIMLRNRIT